MCDVKKLLHSMCVKLSCKKRTGCIWVHLRLIRNSSLKTFATGATFSNTLQQLLVWFTLGYGKDVVLSNWICYNLDVGWVCLVDKNYNAWRIVFINLYVLDLH